MLHGLVLWCVSWHHGPSACPPEAAVPGKDAQTGARRSEARLVLCMPLLFHSRTDRRPHSLKGFLGCGCSFLVCLGIGNGRRAFSLLQFDKGTRVCAFIVGGWCGCFSEPCRCLFVAVVVVVVVGARACRTRQRCMYSRLGFSIQTREARILVQSRTHAQNTSPIYTHPSRLFVSTRRDRHGELYACAVCYLSGEKLHQNHR